MTLETLLNTTSSTIYAKCKTIDGLQLRLDGLVITPTTELPATTDGILRAGKHIYKLDTLAGTLLRVTLLPEEEDVE